MDSSLNIIDEDNTLSINVDVDMSGNEIDNMTQEEIIEHCHKNGTITDAGWRNEEGELIPRFKKEARMNMSMEDEYQIEQWVKQMRRDFPNVDGALCDLVATHCYLHPEEAQSFVKEKTKDLENKKPKDHEGYFKSIEQEHPTLERVN
tara:strand:+ start:345 stop:788 length:444 start_codon:yes stop_codon:yes gene_type:complete